MTFPNKYTVIFSVGGGRTPPVATGTSQVAIPNAN